MIRHASIYDKDVGDGWRVLVMRYWPRGVRRERVDVWLKDAAPSTELLRAYTHEGLAWAEFEPRYRAEMAERPGMLEQIHALEREHGTVTLLCRERLPRDEHCHRVVLAELLATKEPRGD